LPQSLPADIPAHQAMLHQFNLSAGCPADHTMKRQPGRQRVKGTHQLRRDNSNISVMTIWRSAVGRGHSAATLRSSLTTRVKEDDVFQQSGKNSPSLESFKHNLRTVSSRFAECRVSFSFHYFHF